MQKRILSLLVLLAAVVTGAVAQTTYKVSVKEGTEEANKWEITPAEATTTGVAASTAVSAKYSGTKMVKSVKAKKKAAAPSVPDGAINGKFSVSDTKQVYFSKGNLRYASGTWSFFDNQYDYYTSYSADAWDHFGWSASATTYGMNTSTNTSIYSGNFMDWGSNSDLQTALGTGWFTLSSAEWTYLFNTRTVNGGTGSGKSYTLGQKVNNKPGVVIYPDNYTGDVYSGSDWATFESAGCVFLPIAGLRSGTSFIGGNRGCYWSSTICSADDCYYVNFDTGAVQPQINSNRRYGLSVRLVREVATTDAVPVTTYTLLSAATTSDYGKVVCAAGHLHDAKTAVPAGCTAVGILGKVTATGHGLILALQNATSQTWNTINGWTSVTTYAGTTLKVLPDDAARGTNLTSYTALGETAVSNWAVAQKSDYVAIFENLGSTKTDYDGTTYDDNVNAYITSGVGGAALVGGYWSAVTESGGGRAYGFRSEYWVGYSKTDNLSVRPVLGFGGEAVEPAAKTDLLSGVFSVSASKKVNFSKGNLRYASSKWSFFDNQYDYYTSYSADAWDKFGWSTSATTYGMNTSNDNATYSGDFVDWGATMGTGWFTLSSDEWTYLFNARTASIVGGTTDGRYAKAKVNDVQGIILFPDTYTHPDGVTPPTGVNAEDVTGWNGNDYSSADWTKMESAGCVFLPAAGCRNGSSVNYPGAGGYYWSATPNGTDYAYSVYFSSDYLYPATYGSRFRGCSVRLVQATSDAAPATPAGPTDLSTITENYEAKNGETLTGTLTNNVKISIADGATVTLKNVNITNLGNSCNWAGINCPGDATLVLEGTNEVCAGRGGDYGMSLYPGIWIAPNKTLTIQGAGNLTAYSGGPYPDYPYGAGIGGGWSISCGNIVINSGNITATGGCDAAGIGAGGSTGSCGNITINGGTITATSDGDGAGIGGGFGNACGNITISGGTVLATGGYYAAGIGGGRSNGACGTITIKSTVTSVTATKGSNAPNSIGSGGENGTAITVTIEDGANVTQN